MSLNFGPAERFPFVLLALVEANLVSPAGKVVDGICRLLTPAMLQQVSAKDARNNVRTAERLMRDARLLVDALNVGQSQKVRLVGMLDCRLACYLTKRNKEMEGKTFQGIPQIAEVFFEGGTPRLLFNMLWVVWRDMTGVRGVGERVCRWVMQLGGGWGEGREASGRRSHRTARCSGSHVLTRGPLLSGGSGGFQ